jgi:hypothetical protein
MAELVEGREVSGWKSHDQGWDVNTCHKLGLDKASILTGSSEQRDLQKSQFPLVWDLAIGRPPERCCIHLQCHARLSS